MYGLRPAFDAVTTGTTRPMIPGARLAFDRDDDTGGGDGDDHDGEDGDHDDSDGEDGDGEDDDTGEDDDDDLDDDQKKIVNATLKAIDKKLTSMFDRRVNAALREVRRQNRPSSGGGRDDRDNDRDRSRSSSTRDRDSDRDRTRVSQTDLREARLEYRDRVLDELPGGKFASSEERDLAADLAAGYLRDALDKGDTPEDAARDAAERVAERVKKLRARAKRARTTTTSSASRGTQPARGGRVSGTTLDTRAGENKARQMRPDRFPQKTT